MKKDEIQPDEFRDGKRLFNPTKPHGVIYSDASKDGKPFEAKWDQEGTLYRGDRTPIEKPKEAKHASGGA